MKKMESISRKIWKVMAITVIAFVLVIFFLNGTLINSVRNNIIYEELEDQSSDGESHEESFLEDKFEDIMERESLKIAHFVIDRRGNEDKIIVDEFTKQLLATKFEQGTVEKIYNKVMSSRSISEKGYVKAPDANYYFITEESKNEDYVMVYFTHIGKPHEERAIYVFALLLLVLISYFPSKFIANQIGKPILELEDYAVEISNRNWEAKHPETNTMEIDQLCRSLDKMKNDLRIAEERDRQFLQKTSHDLKTPVMIIKGYAQAMIDGIEIDESYPPASVILNESNRLERKIQQLLQLNTIGHSLEQNNDYEIIRLDRLIKSLVSRFEVVKPDIDWQVDLTYYELNGNPESLLVSFENIFENQIRYADTKIEIKMIEDNQKLSIYIRNDGELFTIDNPELLFDPYKKDMEGKFGLGLAIVKRVIESHGGYVEAENEQDGVLFKITFIKN